MYKSMKQTINYNNFLGYGKAEEIFSSMLDDEYVKVAVESGGIGLAKMLYNQMKKEKCEPDSQQNNDW